MLFRSQTPALDAAQKEWEQHQPTWTYLRPEAMRATDGNAAAGAVLQLRPDGAVLASGPNPETAVYELTIRDLPAGVTALRVEVLPDDSLPNHGPGRASNGNFVLTELVATTQLGTEPAQAVALQNTSASFEQTGAAGDNPYGKWAVAAAVDADAKGKTWGWAVMEKVGQPHVAVFETVKDVAGGEGSSLTISLLQNLDNPQHTIGRFRLSVATSARPIRADQAPPPNIAALLAMAVDQRNDAQKNELAAYFRSISPQLDSARKQVAELEKSRKDLDAVIPSTLVTASVQPRMVRVLKRGNWMDDSGEEVTPAFPAVLTVGSAPADQARLVGLPVAGRRIDRHAAEERPPLERFVTHAMELSVPPPHGLAARITATEPVRTLGHLTTWPCHSPRGGTPAGIRPEEGFPPGARDPGSPVPTLSIRPCSD